ncbi:MAG: DUF192 domain-containing protein [Steroidobacteraceae bacterium]
MPSLKRASALAALLPASALLFGASAAVRAQAPAPLDTFPRTTLEVVHHDHQGEHRFRFDVWIADTEERAEQGLMFVRDLPDSKGMVFPLDPPRIETMWMKNTYIELDMLFVGADGRVVKIIERARPLSLDTLSSGQVVGAVVELKGGEAATLGLRVGDRVSWRDPAHKPEA